MNAEELSALRQDLRQVFEARRDEDCGKALTSMTPEERLRRRVSSRTHKRQAMSHDRELLTALREPLKVLLWTECIQARRSDSDISRRFVEAATPQLPRGHAQAEDRKIRASALFGQIRSQHQQLSCVVDVLERLVASEGQPKPTLEELAWAGLQVAPTPAFAIYTAIAEDTRGERQQGQRRLKSLMNAPLQPLHHAVVGQDLAELLWEESGDWHVTLAPLQVALQRDPENPVVAISLLEAALRVGDGPLAVEADAHLRTSSPVAPAVFDEKIQRARAQTLCGPVPNLPQIHLSPIGERLLHALS